MGELLIDFLLGTSSMAGFFFSFKSFVKGSRLLLLVDMVARFVDGSKKGAPQQKRDHDAEKEYGDDCQEKRVKS